MGPIETLNFPQAVLAIAGLYVLWTLVRPFVVRSTIKNIPGPPSPSFLTGNINQYMERHCWEWRAELRNKFGRTATMRALFNKYWLVTYDPVAMHHMFIKEQDTYEEPIISLRTLLGAGLLGTQGKQHRRQRKMLNPVFSTKHLRDMSPLFYEIIHRTRDAMITRIRAGGQNAPTTGAELDMLSWMGRTTLEVLGQAGLGYSFDPLIKDVPDEFATALKLFFPQMLKSYAIRVLMPILVKIGSPAFRRRMVELMPNANVQSMREISDILHARSVLIFNEKKAALERGDEAVKHQVGEGRDIMSILLRANMIASAEDQLPDDELIGQVSTMILAGMDTTANSLARLLLLLAENPSVQERLRAEIFDTIEAEGAEDTLDFERLMELPYLDAVCRETLRLYPGVATVTRETAKDTVLPLATPIRGLNGDLINAVPLAKNTRIIVDVLSCNLDPALWGGDAAQWRPERWIEGLPKEVEEAHLPGVYSHLMTFGGGSRACIGFKFAQVEIKTVILIMLQWFKFEPTDKPIAWNYAAVQYPTVGRESNVPQMPLKVTLLRP
ncbi:cytochrome P450 [Trametes gibbosa]|nr:cytochrome P450 [Trametes gibbosa]KAI0828282.1 cytochrome P450 [Trametes gibbosa]